MTLQILSVNHVNVTVPANLEDAAKHFYGVVLGLPQIPKPEGPRQNIGAWYQIGEVQLHLSVEDHGLNGASDRHVCYLVDDIPGAKSHFADAGIAVIPDGDPMKEMSRFFVRDPGGNLIEITSRKV